MAHGIKFNWGKVFCAGLALGYDHGYAAYRADQAEKRWGETNEKKYLSAA